MQTTQFHQAWSERNEYWLTKPDKRRGRRAVRERTKEPLILCGHGVSMRIERGTLLIKNGFTHHPQEQDTFRFFRGDLTLPPKIIMLDGSGSLSFDVISWLAEQNVSLTRIGWQGDVVSIIGGSGAAYDSERVRWQMETRADHQRRLDFCCALIAEKIANSVVTLKTSLPDTPQRTIAIGRAEVAIDQLERRAVRSVTDILMIEAGAAAAYFTAWRGLPLNWRSRARFPIPDAWLFAGPRRAVRESQFATNRRASHPVNAMLNYGYAILHSQVQIEAVSQGYDPRFGVMHESRPDAQALILDLMEPARPTVDAAVLKFITTQTLSGADFVIRDDGVCRLAPQIARRICGLVVGTLTSNRRPGSTRGNHRIAPPA